MQSNENKSFHSQQQAILLFSCTIILQPQAIMNQNVLKNLNLQGDLILDEAMLQMPINRTKQLQDLFKLKLQGLKIIKSVNNKAQQFRQSRQALRSKISSKPIKNTMTALQKQFQTNNANSSYVVSCVVRALKYRRLAIDDVADIFGIDGQVVEEIDKFRRLRESECEDDPNAKMPNQKLDIQKDILMKQLEMKFKSAAYEKVVKNSLSSEHEPMYKYKNRSPFLKHRTPKNQAYNNYRAQTLSNSELSSIIQSTQQQEEQENLFEYQKLLRYKPPHKIDNKVRAIVQILNRHPNIMQKDIINILADEYNIKNMTQTSISRYYKKIYQMRKYVGVLLEAKREGFIDI